MRTTLDLPDETFRQLKAQAALKGLKLKELVTQLIQRGLATGSPLPVAIERLSAAQPAAGPVLRDPIPIAREADGTVTPYLGNAALYALLDEDDVAQYQRVLSPGAGQVLGP